jgi:glucokinase
VDETKTLSAMPKFAIGIDLGGTTIKTGSVSLDGTILFDCSVDSRANENPSAVIDQILLTIRTVFDQYPQADCVGIGVGSPGIITVEGGIVQYPPNFALWTEVALGKRIQQAYPDFPVMVENDANVAAIAESRFGAGKEIDSFIFIIWGTGVGGGIIINNSIFRGPSGGAGEIGHISVDCAGRQCNCGNKGCIEAYIGQRYLSQRTREQLERSTTRSRIVELVDGDLTKIEPIIISMAAMEGDELARNILVEAGELLGCALSSAVNLLDVPVAIIGGGISAAPDFVFDAILTSLHDRVMAPHKPNVRVLRAKLGNSAGMIGAASLVM